MRKTLFIVLIMLNTALALHCQIYVSTKGNDSYNGSSNYPVKSLVKAIALASDLKGENQKIIVAGGEYILNSSIEINSALWIGQKNLLVEGDKDHMPIIKGSVSVGKFTKRSGAFWTLDLSSFVKKNKMNIQQIFVNGKRATLARTPNLNKLYATSKVEENKDKTNKKSLHTIYLTPEQWKTLNTAKDKKNILVAFNHQWNRTRTRINNSASDTKSIQVETSLFPDWVALDRASQFYFENSLSFLDSPGEWFLDDKNILYYMPREGEIIANTVVEIPLLNELLKIEGTAEKKVKNITFKNISFQHTNRIMSLRGDMPAQSASPTTAAVTLNFAENISFDNCEIANVSNNAAWIRKGCDNVKILNSYIHDLGIGGIKIGDIAPPPNAKFATQNIAIENNIIRYGGQEIPTGVGVIIFHSGNNIVSHNEISHFLYSGVSVGWVWGYRNSVAKNNKIIYNHIHHLGFSQLSDLGGVYTLGPSPGTEISNNVIHDVFSNDFRGWGIYLDEGSSDILMENNLVYNCKSAGFHQHYGKNNIVRNNIFANQVNSQLEVSRKENHNSFTFTNNIVYYTNGKLSDRTGWDIANFVSDNNIYWNPRQKEVKFYYNSFDGWKTKTKKDVHSYILDPYFNNPESNDFTFKSTSNIKKINFKPFDYRKAGVTDSNIWKKAVL
ncbi:Right handed beta helix region [anaerobic digester metagenome]